MESETSPDVVDRIYVTGRIAYKCKHCGHFNYRHVQAQDWKDRCDKCRKHIVIAGTQADMPAGGASRTASSAFRAIAALASV